MDALRLEHRGQLIVGERMARIVGTIRREGRSLSIYCAFGKLDLRTLKVPMAAKSARIDAQPLATSIILVEDGAAIEFSTLASIAASKTLVIQ